MSHILLSSVVTSLISLCFLTFSIVFQKTALLISLKKSSSKSIFAFFLNSVFILMYDFSQAFLLNIMYKKHAFFKN